MASNGLVIDTDLVNSSGSGINASGTNFQAEVASFKSHSEAILSIWTGPDADEFSKISAEVTELLDKASVTVQDVGTHLVDTATAFDSTVEENKSRMSGI